LRADEQGVWHLFAEAGAGERALTIPPWLAWGIPLVCLVAAVYLVRAGTCAPAIVASRCSSSMPR
jgi:hypothetical protein